MQNIIGHESQQEYLRRVVSRGEVHHAFLFLGPSQVGKNTMAVWFAQLLFCQAQEKPCGICSSCHQIQEKTHPDVLFLQKEADKKNISVEQVREMIQKMSQSAFLSSWKVAIISEAGHLNAQASNALLKSLEEPSGKTVYILISSQEQRVLPTIKSRCVLMRFLPVSLEKIQKILQEKGVSSEDANVFSVLSHGRPGLAMQVVQEEEKMRALDAISRLKSCVGQKDLAKRFQAVEGLWPLKATMNEQVGVARVLLDSWISVYQVALEQKELGNTFAFLKVLSMRELAQGVDQIVKTKALLQENVNVRLALENLVLCL